MTAKKRGQSTKSQASSGPIFEILGGGTSDHGSIPGNAWAGGFETFSWPLTSKSIPNLHDFPWSEKSSKTTGFWDVVFFRNWSFEGIAININTQVKSVTVDVQPFWMLFDHHTCLEFLVGLWSVKTRAQTKKTQTWSNIYRISSNFDCQ